MASDDVVESLIRDGRERRESHSRKVVDAEAGQVVGVVVSVCLRRLGGRGGRHD